MLPKKRILFIFVLVLLGLTKARAQDDNPYFGYEVPSQNLLKYNRFLINPTFSTVREDKSYINLLHRNQSVEFDDNNQNYFLSYSGRISDRTGLGLSLYTQRLGALSNYGVLANYAYGIKLSDKSNFTFGANISYYNSGFDESRATTVEEDPFLAGFQDQNLLSFQPGFNLSYGNFDIGVFAENLFDYNLKTSESLTEFADKTYSGHLQYTHQFNKSSGILESGRLMPLARVRMDGEDDKVTLGGSLILDLPKLGWVQAGYDSFYGASAGVGFNLNQRISLGYTMEKGLSNNFDTFGLTHEISFAYSFTPNLTEDRVMLEDDTDDLVQNELEPKDVTTNEEIEELKRKLAENDAIIEELMFRQDSLEMNRQADLERRFNMVMRMVRNETKGERPDLEKRAEQIFRGNNSTPQTDVASTRNVSNDGGGATATAVSNQNQVKKDAVPNTSVAQNTPKRNVQKSKPSTTVVQDKITTRKFKDLPDVTDGYYVVANVYKGTQYLDKFLNQLESKGINANYIDNPNNGLKYVYLDRYDTWEEAVEAHKNNMDGAYTGKTWIMNVENRYTNEAYADNVNKLKEKASKYDTETLRKNVIAKDNLANNGVEPKNYRIEGIGAGYYIIANVFANPKNANRFVDLLNSYGLSASYFINPENNYRYVYLKRHDSWSNALISYYSKLNNAYDDKMWIMRVANHERQVT
ncbi:PorP/SprF family type IX secretion system membrane protein [Maribacter thermophilus]|uniref:PorP/SprF family type IX secretion system membrane protein n=1 Tax=Maribacter thermophilus TaxID=1197874 RepID=UPI0006410747|nr:type IX secretion system membrane protein PorP/SprF [Maribacter thermophilus]